MKLKLPQARVLNALLPLYPDDSPDEWPIITRHKLGLRAGFTAVSGSVNRALRGIQEGSTSGKASPGLLALGLVETINVNVDGVSEMNYRITAAGISAIEEYLAAGNVLPEVRDPSTHTNIRYIPGNIRDGDINVDSVS